MEIVYGSFHKKKTVFNIDKKCLTTKSTEIIRMTSEGSCDIEDRRNANWKFSVAITAIYYILKYIKIENSYFELEYYFCFGVFLF